MKKDDKVKIYKLSKKRRVNEKLLESINELLKVLSPGKGKKIDSMKLKSLVAHPHFETFILEKDGEIAGMANLFYVETFGKKMAWVEEVVVHTKHQGKGLGKKIMMHLIGEAKKQKVGHLELTSNSKRVAANKLYQKLRFEPRNTNVYRLKIKKK